MNPSLRRPLLAALTLVAALAARPALATTYVMMSDAALADQAAVVIDARVTGAEPAAAFGQAPVTDYRVEVERVLKGDVPGGVLIVRVPGGIDASQGVGLKIFGAPELAAGERTLLFLRPAGDGTYRILHLMLGAFHRRAVEGRTVAVRDLSEAHALQLPGRRGGEAEGDVLRDFAGFSSWVADRAAGLRADPGYVIGRAPAKIGSAAEKLFRGRPTGDRSTTSALVADSRTKFTHLLPGDGVPIRWFGFDSGQQVSWRVHAAGQPGLGEAATAAAFEVALQAWNDDPQTNVRYAFAGITGAGAGLTRSDGVNAILFDDPYRDDPNEAVEGTFSCAGGGVIAMGGPFFYSSTRSYKGARYHEAVEGDIVTNDGTDCFFRGNPRVAEEVFAHELGHTLGLGHSSDFGALMFARAHDDGRGARLGADDLAAVASLYGTGAAGPAALAAPRRLAARAGSRTTVILTWRDRALGEQGYAVEVQPAGGAWLQAKTLVANSTTTAVRRLQPGVTYRFRVRALGAGDSSPYSNVALATTPR